MNLGYLEDPVARASRVLLFEATGAEIEAVREVVAELGVRGAWR